ncbi:RlpA-like double-psi beta-barrel-protein domain-containing protein-containing protein [Lactifluus volemus]|nr:RlpA-like double-psi beta-barrel-protein domain-containing protein-containing protein [Lactifluus volemus]
MFRTFAISLVALSVVSNVSALIILRDDPQKSHHSLEPYSQHYTRYQQLDCDERTGTQFFQDAATANDPPPGSCTTQNNSSSSPSPDDCDGGDDDPSSSDTTPSPNADTSATPVDTPTSTPTTSAPSPADGQVYSGDATFYKQDGAKGACGQAHSDEDFICALDRRFYADGKYCGKKIRITGNGKQVTVVVADECMGCDSPHSLDLSVAAFHKLADEKAGVAHITWEFE